MDAIMSCQIGKHFVYPEWVVSFGSPYYPCNFNLHCRDSSPPYPSKHFDREEVVQFRLFLDKLLEEYDRIKLAIDEMNA